MKTSTIPALYTLALAAALSAAPAAWGAAGPWRENPQSRVRLITPYAAAPAEGEVRLGLQVTVVPGWHVYWKNSGDAGYPPAIDFAPTPAVAAAELLWPAPERYELPGDLVAFGYEREVVYPIRARLAAGGKESLTLAADLDYLVCEVDCIPYSYRVEVEQPLAADPEAVEADPATGPLLAGWWERLPAPAEAATALATRGALDLADPERPALVVEVEGEAARRAARPDLFLEVHERFAAGAPRVETTAAGLRFRVPLAYRELPRQPPARSEFAWTVTGLDAAGGGPAAIEARRTVEAAAVPAAAAAPRRALLALRSPAALSLLALAATALALHLWGLLAPPAAAAGEAVPDRRRREALGFAAAGAAVALLYALALEISADRLAAIELSLLAGALAAWLRRRAGGRRLPRAALSVALALLAALVLWLAIAGPGARNPATAFHAPEPTASTL